MAFITTTDGVKLYFEETGRGSPIIFVHEFAGDHRSWEPQVRHFSRRFRCITFNARGFIPSDVPDDPEMYSQNHARDDILAVLDGLEIESAHIVGLSMGGFATLHFGLKYPSRASSLVIAGCGYGAKKDSRDRFQKETTEAADRMEAESMAKFGVKYALGPTRVQFQNKDPRGWLEFETQLKEHSTRGSANTMRGVLCRRPSLYDLKDQLQNLTIPTLIVNGDEDDPCLEAGLFMKKTIRSAALVLLPRTGHACNLEEPALFNSFCGDFFAQVDADRWELRDQRSITEVILWASEKNPR